MASPPTTQRSKKIKVIMLSLDRTLLGEQGGDTVSRHRLYGKFVQILQIVIFCQPGYQISQLSDNVIAYPTNAANKLTLARKAIRVVKDVYNHEGGDLLVAQGLTAIVGYYLKRRLNLPLLINMHAEDVASPDWLKSWWRKFCLPATMVWLLKRAEGVRVVSAGVKNNLIKRGIPANKIQVIPTPIDIRDYLKVGRQRFSSLATSQSTLVLLFDGRLEPVKNVNLLLKIFKEVARQQENIFLIIHGQGSQREKLEKLASSLSLAGRVKFVGLKSLTEQINLYLSASSSESFGQSFVKAQAAGLPVVAARTAGASSIIKNGQTGFLIKAGNREEFIKKTTQLINDSKLRDEMGQRAVLRVAKKFDQQKNIKKMIKFWRQIVSSYG